MSTTLERFADALRAFNQIVESDQDQQEKYAAILHLGLDYLNLDMGLISHVEGNTYTIVASATREGDSPAPGTTFDLGQTYCVHTLQAGAPTAFEEAGKSTIASHPCYTTFGLEAYIGVPILADGRAWGTLNFTSAAPRRIPFSEADFALLETFAQWISLYMRFAQQAERVREADETLRLRGTLLDAVANAIMITDAGGHIEWVNPAFTAMTGYTLNEVRGHTPRILSSGRQKPEVYARLWQTISKGEVWKGELINRRKNGQLYHEEQTITPVMDARGNITRFIAIKEDVSHRYALDRLKHEFISVVSHELRTPLTAIRGSLGLLTSPAMPPLPDKARELLNIANDNCERLVRLVNDILDVEKIEANEMPFDLQPVMLETVLRSVAEQSEGICREHGIRINLSGNGLSARLLGDADRLHQLFLNLIANAISFSPDGQQIDVTARLDGGRIHVRIRDYGPGVPESFVPHLFDKFAQAQHPDTRTHGGSGLGLAIARAIAEHHGGHLSYAAPEDGPGACFEVTLPALESNPLQLPGEAPARHLLLAAADPALHEAVIRHLDDSSWQLSVTAEWPPSCTTVTPAPDAILVPASLGTARLLDGIAQIRRRAGCEDVPVIVLQGDESSEPSLTHLQAVDVLRSPFREGDLRRCVARLQCIRHGQRGQILYVEDDPSLTTVVAGILADIADVHPAHSLRAARDWLSDHDADLILLDQRLPDGHGLSLIHWLQARGSQIPVVVISGYPLSATGLPPLAGFLQKGALSNGQLQTLVAELIAPRHNGTD